MNITNPAVAPEALRPLVEQGLSAAEIAAKIGLTHRYVQKRLVEAGLKPVRPQRRRIKATHCHKGHPTPEGSRIGSQCPVCHKINRERFKALQRVGMTQDTWTERLMSLGRELEDAATPWRRAEVKHLIRLVQEARHRACQRETP